MLIIIFIVAKSKEFSEVDKQNEQRTIAKENSGESSTCTSDLDCPLWTECNNTKCECRANLEDSNNVRCDKITLELSVIRCHCVTYDNSTNKLMEGNCLENCENSYDKNEYLPLPFNVSQVNKFMCEKWWKRTGRLCGQCLPGHSPLAYSYDMRCVKCPEGNRNIWKYILVAYGPLTVFYILFLLFKINITSSYIHSYVTYSQTLTNPLFTRAIIGFSRHTAIDLKNAILMLIIVHSIWNLDFLRGIYPEICLDVSTLTVLALDYAVAIYPLLLTLLSYILIELYARNCRLVVIFWKPFQYFLSCFFRNGSSSRTTVIDAFSSFFLLSFTKMVSTSVDLLTPVKAVDLSNNKVNLFVYNDATMEYFGREHLPYAVLAIVCSTVFAVLPVLLLLIYQFRWFQRLLSCLKLRHPLLQEVMESFQSCYTNGTQPGTKDHRWFSAMHYIFRYVNMIVYSSILDSGYILYGAVTVVSVVILTAITQPYKNPFRTKTDVLFMGMFGLFFCLDGATSHPSLRPPTEYMISTILKCCVVVVPPFFVLCTTIYWILKKTKKLLFQARAWRKGYAIVEEDYEASLPDRIINPGNYQQGHNQSLDPVCLIRTGASNCTSKITY